jgi:hypothetical protein
MRINGTLSIITNDNLFLIVLIRPTDKAEIVALQPRQQTTSDDMKALYGG